MIVEEESQVRDRLHECYVDHALAQARAGIIDHSLNIALLEGKTIEEHMVDVLRAAGKLPPELEQHTRERRSA